MLRDQSDFLQFTSPQCFTPCGSATRMEVENDTTVFMRENRDLSDFLLHFNDPNDGPVRKKVRFDAPRGQSIDVIPGIPRQLPREDGYIDTLEESRTASQRPYNRQYLQEQLTRWQILEKNPYYQFIVLFAGAANCPVLDLMDRDDLERRLRERQQADLVMRKEVERSIVPLQEKQDELVLAKNTEGVMLRNQQTLRVSAAIQNLTEIGSQLIDQCFVSLAMALARLRVITSKESYITNPENERGLAGQQLSPLFDMLFPHSDIEHEQEDEESVKELTVIVREKSSSWHSLKRGGLKRRLLLRLYLDTNSSQNVNALVQCLKQGVAKNAVRLASDDALARPPSVVKTENESTTTSSGTSITTSGGTTPMTTPIEEGRLQMSLIGPLFARGVILSMTRWACANEYGEHKIANAPMNYTEWAMAFINTTDKDRLRELGSQYNIFEEQPQQVLQLISHATGGARDELAINTARWVMTEHFLWLYFHNRSLAGLALDAYRQKDGQAMESKMNELRQSLEQALTEAEPTLALFFARVRYGLASGQTLQTNDYEQNTPIVRLPYEVTELPSNASFQAQNEATRDFNPQEMILDEDFRVYYTQGKTEYDDPVGVDDMALQKPMTWLREGSAVLERLYPVLILYSLFRGYAAYERIYARHLTRRLKNQKETIRVLEKKIDEISREVNSTAGEQRRSQYVQTRGFTAQPVNSGIIKLESQAVNALDKAYGLVQKECEGLAGIGDETLTHRLESIQSGLGGDYARLAALVLAEIRFIFPDKYNTTHQLQYTLMSTTSALNALKRYSYSWDGDKLHIRVSNTATMVKSIQSMNQLIERAARPGDIATLLF